MIQKLTLLLLVIATPVILLAQPPESQQRFNEGNFELENRNYTRALAIYSEIESGGIVSGPLFINMAISYVFLDSLGLAKYYFLKATQYPEVFIMAREGIRYTENELSRRSAVLPELTVNRLYNHLVFEFKTTRYVILAIILINLGVGLLMASFFGPSKLSVMKWVSYPVSGIGVLILVFCILQLQVSASYERSVQIVTETPLKIDPDENSEVIISSYEGYLARVNLKISRMQDNWYFVVLDNGSAGWIPRNSVKLF